MKDNIIPTDTKKTSWLTVTKQANGYFMAYAILLFGLSLWFISSGMKFYTAETGFHYKAENQLAVEQYITELQSKYPISNSQIHLEEIPGKHGRLVVNFEEPTAEHDNELFILAIQNHEYLYFDYDDAFLISNPFTTKTSYLIVYALLTLLIFIYWRLKFYHFEQIKQSWSNWIVSLLMISAWVVAIIFCLQIYGWTLKRMGVEFQSDATQMGTLLHNNPLNYLLSMVILAPIQEELVFRGIMLRLFINQNRFILGTLITSSLFAALHQIQMLQQPITDRINNYLVTFIASVLLCYIYHKYRRIGTSIFAHALFNLLMSLLAVGIPF